MKISNEFKIGALTIFAVLFLFLGFNFLKGKNIFKNGYFLYAKFSESKGLQTSNPVIINGFQAGSVYSIKASKDLREITVEIKLNQDFLIPENSLASINSNPLGASSLEIDLGDGKTVLSSGDTLRSTYTEGLFGQVSSQIVPLADQAKLTLRTADSLISSLNKTMDSSTRQHLQQTVENLSHVTSNLVYVTGAVQKLLETQSEAIASTLANMNKFAANLSENNARINASMMYVESATKNLSELQIQKTLDQLSGTMAKLDSTIVRINSKEGTIGALINDRKIYDQLSETTRSINTLLDDLRVNPKRYVHFSLFGKKADNHYLVKPLEPTKGYTPLNKDSANK